MITLKFLTDTHEVDLAKVANDPQVSATSGVPFPCEREIVQAWITENQAAQPREMRHVILYGSLVVGCSILRKIDWTSSEAELAYWIGSEYWGMGIGSAASQLMRDMAFDAYHLERLNAHYLKLSNVASGKILQKLGFVPDTSRAEMAVEGRFQHLAPDVWTFCTLSRERWHALSFTQTAQDGMQE